MIQKIYSKSIFLLLLIAFIFSSCTKDPAVNTDPITTPYTIQIPPGFPTNLNIPADNPMTVEGIALGRYLFYDGRLSGRSNPDSLMSCGTCHLQSKAFECGIDHPVFTGGRPFGLTKVMTPHVMLPFINLVFNNEGYLWNGLISKNNNNLGNATYGVPAVEPYNMKNIESLLWMSIYAKHEFNGTIDKTVNMIKSIPMYAPMFKAAFGTEEVTYDRISKALAQFIRTLISSNSKFDKYVKGEVQLSTSELRGYTLFNTETGGDCFHCHGTVLFTTNDFYNNAKDTIFNDPRDRYAVTKIELDRGAYKATTLRNIELTGPYMHDGRFKTLDEVINFYSEGLIYSKYVHPLMKQVNNEGVQLNPLEKADLKAFLLTLTDQSFLTNPAFSNPFNQK